MDSNDKAAIDAVVDAISITGKKPLFLSVHGSRVYHTAIDGSDYDVVGSFMINPEQFLGIFSPGERSMTLTGSMMAGDVKVEYHLHEIGKFCSLVTRCNPNALESVFATEPVLYGPMTSSDGQGGRLRFVVLQDLSLPFITRLLYNPYAGIYGKFKNEFTRGKDANVKKIINVFRSLMIGMHVLEHGHYEFNVEKISKERGYHDVYMKLMDSKVGKVMIDVARIKDRLDDAMTCFKQIENDSPIPEIPGNECKKRLNEFVIQLRTGSDWQS